MEYPHNHFSGCVKIFSWVFHEKIRCKDKKRYPSLSWSLSAKKVYLGNYSLNLPDEKSEMQKIWKLKEQADINDIKQLSAALNVDMAIANLLVQRGIKTLHQPKHFSVPSLATFTIRF